jgi:branched-chain amino acid transport system substrate-binding protein
VEGGYVVSGPAVIAEQLPDNHPSKKIAVDFVEKYEKSYGAGSRNQFAGHGHDAGLILEKIIPMALKKAKPGTKEFRAALREAMETMGPTPIAHGVIHWTHDNHWGFPADTGVMLKVVGGNWKVE